MRSESNLPCISVLIPWISGRGVASRAIESWTKLQNCPGRAFEIIIATEGSGREIYTALSGLIDEFEIRVLTGVGSTYPEQINACAKHALGDWILITELHVEARPDCLSRVLAWIQNDSDGFDGAPIETASKYWKLAGRMESALYQAASQGWNDPTHWHGVRVRGTVLGRHFFLDRNGFNPRYELACDIAFGLEAQKDGHCFGRITPVCADHWENMNLRDVFGDAYAYSKGEASFRLYGSPGLAEKHLGPSEVFQKKLTSKLDWRRVQFQLMLLFIWRIMRFILAPSTKARIDHFRSAFVVIMELGRCATLSRARS